MQGLIVILGAVVVFVIGYIFTRVVVGMIRNKVEVRNRKRTGLIPPLNEGAPDMDTISIIGGIAAVLLALILLFIAPRESRGFMWSVIALFAIICGIGVYFLFLADLWPTRSIKAPAAPVYRPSPKLPSSKDKLYQNLLMKTKNDREMADRLIAYERRHHPKASEEALIQSAIDRWELDNNR